MGSETVVLEVEGLSKRFGGVTALADYALRLETDELVGLIGPNGAGKTTAFNLLSGVSRPSGGRIRLCGRDLAGRRADQFARGGIARTFQNIRLFRDLTVWENVAAGLHMHHGPGWVATMLGLPSVRRRETRIRADAEALLRLVGLADLAEARAGELPYGSQRKLEIAQALATEPKVLLLDEPAAGMNPTETKALAELIAGIHRSRPIAIVLVEHDMRLVMSLCRRVQVLNRGRLLADATPGEIQADPQVIEAYLGRRRERHDA